MSHNKAFVALSSLSPPWKQLCTRFVEALKVEAEKRGEGWEFIMPRGGGGLEGMLREPLDHLDDLKGVQLVVVLFGEGDTPSLREFVLGYVHALGIPMVGVGMGSGSEEIRSFFGALEAPLVVWKPGEGENWEGVARAIFDRVSGGGKGRRESPALARYGMDLRPPCGFQGICRVFGFIEGYVRDDGTLDPSWEEEMLGYARIPFYLPLSWAPEKKITRIRCHRLLAPVFEVLFQELVEGGLRPLVRTYGGCFCFRRMRGGGHLSTHSWGIAIDLNPDTNRLGTPGDMAPELVELFENFGFTWGGTFSRPDPMHFQFCSGY